MRTLHLTSSLGPIASARYLSLVLPKLEGEHFVLNLGPALPFTEHLRGAGISVEQFAPRGFADLSLALKLRKCVAAIAPRLLHAWGTQAAIISNVLAGLPVPIVAGDLDRSTLLSKALTIRFRNHPEAIRNSQPIVDPRPITPIRNEPVLGVPENAKIVLNVGGFDRTADPRTALWSFDMLRYVREDVHLLMVGDGPLRAKMELFARCIARTDRRMEFLGVHPEPRQLLSKASVVFFSHRSGGRTFLAEALASGTPVVAVESETSRSMIRDGDNGLLVDRSDYPAQAKALLRVLTDPEFAGRLSQRAQQFTTPTPEAAAKELLAFYRAIPG